MKSSTKRIALLAFTLTVMFLCAAFYIFKTDSTPPEHSSFALTPGAEIRLSEDQLDLRFETRILTEELVSLGSDVTIGTLILPTDLKNGSLTVNTPGVLNLSTTVREGNLAKDGEYTVFRATVVNIKPGNYTRAFSAVSYLKVGEKYYYTPYSDENNSRSLWQSAVEAWIGDYRDNETVKDFLDKIVVINGSMIESRTVTGYTSPYNVSYRDNILSITAKDGSLVEGDITTILLDYDHKAYTSGWTLENNVLTARFDAKLNLVENFDSMSRAPGGSFDFEQFSVEFSSDPPSGLEPDGGDNHYAATDTSVAVNDGSLTYVKGNTFDASYPIFTLKGDVASALGEENDTLTISLSLRLASGYKHVPPLTFKLMGDRENSVTLCSTYETTLAHGAANEQGEEIATLTTSTWIDVTFRIDLIDAKMKTYCNGVLKTTARLEVPEGFDSLLDWAKASLTESAFAATAGTMNYYRPNGIRFDSMSWGVSRTHTD